jgi:N-acetylmuramoyl-L-alanine amidase
MLRLAVALVLAAVGAVDAATTLEGVDVVRGHVTSVRIRLTDAVTPIAHSLAADGTHPPRVYLDLPGTTLDTAAPSVVAGSAGVLRVRTGQFDRSTARVVLDLASPVDFVVQQDATTITVVLGAQPAPQAQRPAPAPETEHPTPAPEARQPAPTPEAQRPVPPAPEASAAPSAPVPPPPAPAPPPLAYSGGTQKAIVVLDAGHGGHDPGATGVDGLMEKTITLDLARRVRDRLSAVWAVDVRLTRDDDRFVPIDARLAGVSSAALFVSLHVNAAADPGLSGVEVFFGGGGSEPPECGPGSPIRLGLDVAHAIDETFGESRTVLRPGTFGVLRRNAVPSVLVEIGYLTNPADRARLGDDDYRARMAIAVADGAAAFLRDAATTLAAR